jgi:long-chain fatty acid transport protein
VGTHRTPLAPRPATHRRIAAGLAFLSVPFWVNDAAAAGFALREYSFEAASTAFAGASAQSGSPSFLAYNPATGSGVSDWDEQFTLNAIYPTSNAAYDVATTSAATPAGGRTNPDDFILDAYEPAYAMRGRLDDRWTWGVAVTVPWGLGTRYGKTWAGRYYAVESKLITINASPSVAYAINDRLTISAGAQIEYAKGTLSNAIDFGTIGAGLGVPSAVPGANDGFVEINASAWAFGYTAGLLWKPVDDLSLGLSYRSALQHELRGDVDFTLDSAGVGATLAALGGAFVDTRGAARLDLPAITALGLSWQATPELTVLAELDYTQWSSFRELRVRFDNPMQPDSVQTYAWKDTMLVAGGLTYKAAPDWTLRAGVAVDETPTRDATRDPRIPDATRTWLSFGIAHELSPHTTIELGYSRLSFPKEPIALRASTPGNEVRGNLSGQTDADADMISIQFVMH